MIGLLKRIFRIQPKIIIKGKAAKRFYDNINKGKISPEQQKFLDSCVEFLDSVK